VTKVMEGIRVLEVAQFTFVPAAGAILADWGADVIKVERPVRGETQRGFIKMGGFTMDSDRHPLIEHPNRGKRSVGIDVSTPGGQEVLYEIAKTADVFLTNNMPAQRQKNRFDVEHIRAVNPKIIYARGSAYGDKDRNATSAASMAPPFGPDRVSVRRSPPPNSGECSLKASRLSVTRSAV
jgi:crotonobetainyl-CoA:carnitine CoA-transferase CaiB-like acyl-CoA transferase